MSPSIEPSTCRSAEAVTLPLMETSDPITEKVEEFWDMDLSEVAGRIGSAGFFENIWG